MKKIIAIVGMPGAGKSEAGVFFKEKGFPVLRFGSVVIDGVTAMGLPINAENERKYREQIRKELGMAAIAIKMDSKITAALEEANIIILDGLYSWEEYLYLIKKFPSLFLLCLYAQPSIRYTRLETRPIRPLTKDIAKNRDIAEISSLNKGGPIAMADYLVKNETTKEYLHQELEKFLETIT